MAKQKSEAWLTIAAEDELVENAIILAESLRRVKTTKTIAVVASRSLGIEKRISLKKAFDTVFYVDEDDFRCAMTDQSQFVRAFVQVFSLFCFQKCVLISPNSMVLENVDKLFESYSGFEFFENKTDQSIEFSILKFEPNMELWNSLLETVCRKQEAITANFLLTFLRNQYSDTTTNDISENIVANFSMANGALLTEITHPQIVQFVDIKTYSTLQNGMESLVKGDLDLLEKHIVHKWLNICHQTLSSSVNDTTPFYGQPKRQTDFLNEPIAIIGMSCRYPGANNLEEFWNLLFEGKEGIQEPPSFRWTKEHTSGVTEQDRRTNAGFLKVPVDEFDEKFFGVSPKEAVIMDAQVRLLHEVFWESLEDSGIDPLSLYGSHTGIFTGSWMYDYNNLVQESNDNEFFRRYMGNGIGAGAARLSFLLGLTGPSIATESGCSSGIVALDLAVKSLRNGETNLALAAGVNLILNPFSGNNMDFCIAPNGRCKTFDAKADGFGRAEGCGVLVLKRLSDALQDRDNIWAIIRGSAVAQEGLSRSLGTPTVHCEALAMQLAIKDANVPPEQVSFVETHGSGTAVGDPIEVAAISKAYKSSKREKPLVIGCVKTNVGHTESCSGITGIMKTVLAMHHQLIPRHRNLETINPEIFLDSIPAQIPMEPIPWPKVKGQPRIAGVSSFGITGTDGHVIIQEPPEYELPRFTLEMERPKHIFKISGKTSNALEKLLEQYQNYFAAKVEADANLGFENAAFSANVGRASFNHRAFIIANNYKEAAENINRGDFLQGEVAENESRQICFLFTGQGSQYKGMAKTLYDTSPVFRIHFDYCERILKETYQLSIKEVLWNSDNSFKQLSRTIYSQTGIFCVEYCLFKLWQSWGIQPDFVLGHSLGEFCAAVAAGILDFKDALKLVAERSRLIDSLPRGSMLVLKASKPEVDNLLKSAKMDLDFAAVNSPEQTVVAGDNEKIENFLAFCKDEGVKGIILEATHAFHSRHMDPMLEKYRKIAESVDLKEGNEHTQYISGMEGRIIGDASEINANYWVRHTREKVSFLDACAALQESECCDFLEVGPHPVLSSFVMMNNEGKALNILSSLRRGKDDWHTILTSLGKLYLLGYKINWKGYDEPYERNKVSLPFHPFNRRSFWVESAKDNVSVVHPLLGSYFENASASNIFQNNLRLNSVPYLKDHCIGNRILFPGACYIEMCLTAGYYLTNSFTQPSDLLLPRRNAISLENIKIDAPLELKEKTQCRLQVVVDLPESGSSGDESQTKGHGFCAKVYHQNTFQKEKGKWVLHTSSIFNPVPSTKEIIKTWNPNRVSEIISNSKPFNMEMFYSSINNVGLKFGDSFRTIQNLWSTKSSDNSDEVVAQINIPSDYKQYFLHPLIIDAAFQSGMATTYLHEKQRLKVPVLIGKVIVFPEQFFDSTANTTKQHMLLYSWCKNDRYNTFVATSNLLPVALIEGIQLMDTTVRTIESVLEQQSSSIPQIWEESWRVIPSPFSTAVQLPDINQVFEDPQVQQRLLELEETSPQTKDMYDKIKKLIYLYILDTLYELNWKPNMEQVIDVASTCSRLGILPQFQQLVRFYFVTLEEEGDFLRKLEGESWRICNIPPSPEKTKLEINSLYNYLKDSKDWTVVNEIYKNIWIHLARFLRGEESALDHLFPKEDNKMHLSAQAYYLNHPSSAERLLGTTGVILKSIFKATQHLAKQNSSKVFRILEVGAGTGSFTSPMLECLQEHWGDNFQLYYTDISPSFFVKAGKKFEKFNKNIKYAVFNLEQSPMSQGIPLNYFDMVVATDVLHATRSLQECLVHLRQTLRPGGVLSFSETVVHSRDVTYLFGLLEGYWRFEDFMWRPYHCCVGVDVWEKILINCGYHSVNSAKTFVDSFACITAVKDPELLETKLEYYKTELKELKNKWIVFSDKENFQITAQIANMLAVSGNKVVMVIKCSKKQMDTSGIERSLLMSNVTVVCLQKENKQISREIESILEDNELEGKVQGVVYAWALDLKEKDQNCVSLPLLHIIKKLYNYRRPPQLFVFTQGVYTVNDDTVTCNPTAATLLGMAKSLKNEKFDMFVRCIDLEQGCAPSTAVDQILFELAMTKQVKEEHRVQVVYRNKVRYEPRLVLSTMLMQKNELKIPPIADKYHLILPKSRLLQDLEFDRLEMANSLGKDEVEIQVKAYALNFRDIFNIIKPSAVFENSNTVGVDFAGVVSRVGSDTFAERVKVGDRVFGTNFKDTQLPSHKVAHFQTILQIPDTMTFWEASTLPTVFFTAYYCLVTIAEMRKGDTVLIHTGSGGVGLAAIQLAKHVGANIITTAGNKRKRNYLRSIGIRHVFHSRNTSFKDDILRVTNGNGVDIVLNSITGPGIKEATLESCAKNAQFLEMSKLSIWTKEEVKQLRPDVRYEMLDLSVLPLKDNAYLIDQLGKHLNDGNIKPIPYVKFDALNIRQAFEYFQKAMHIGKVVCVMPEIILKNGDLKVNVPLFNGDSTYWITGGLGGIGFEVCKWMIKHGATDLVLSGRNPPKPEIAEQIERLNRKGVVTLIVKLGDVGNYDHCKAVVDEICHHNKPLRGVMHCAGVIQDNLYANQTWKSFETTYNAKVNGTLNLHKLTTDILLEHFILFSSTAAIIGPPGQGNHAAATCFEDAFIHYRHSLGLAGTTINWGQWSQVGVAREMTLLGIRPTSTKSMLKGLKMVLKTQRKHTSICNIESYINLNTLCPFFKFYLDEKLWNLENSSLSKQKVQSFTPEQTWEEMDKLKSKEEKTELMSNYLKNILRAGLRLDSSEPIGSDVNLQQLGVDSLMMIELKNSIQDLLGNRANVTASLLKNCTTVRQISTSVIDLILSPGPLLEKDAAQESLSEKELTQLLTKDSILTDDITALLQTLEPPTKPSKIRTIFITGITGKVAPYLLSELAQSHGQVQKIYCLIRDKSGDDGSTNLFERVKTSLKNLELDTFVDMTKVECIFGDVAIKNFGISQDKYEMLCKNVDAVIHCAAKIHYSENYMEHKNENPDNIRSVNVGGIQNVLKFATTTKIKHVYYPSGFYCGIFEECNDGSLSDDWPGPSTVQTIVTLKLVGLKVCKFICEMLLKQGIERKIPIKVFRFSWIAGDSRTGRLNYLNNMYILRFLTFLKLKAMPSIVAPGIFVPVDICADHSLKLFFRDDTPFGIFNIGHPKPQVELEFVKVAKEDFGVDVNIVEWGKYADLLKEHDVGVESLQDLYDEQRQFSMYMGAMKNVIQGYRDFPETFFKNKKVSQYIPNYEESVPTSMETITKDLKYLKQIGFFETFGI